MNKSSLSTIAILKTSQQLKCNVYNFTWKFKLKYDRLVSIILPKLGPKVTKKILEVIVKHFYTDLLLKLYSLFEKTKNQQKEAHLKNVLVGPAWHSNLKGGSI